MRLQAVRAGVQRVQVTGQLMVLGVLLTASGTVAVIGRRIVAAVDRCGFHLVVQVLIDRVVAVRVAARIAKLLADKRVTVGRLLAVLLLLLLLFKNGSAAGRLLVIAGGRTAGRTDLVATVGGRFVHHIHIQHHMHTLITADQQVGCGRRRSINNWQWFELQVRTSEVNFIRTENWLR